MVQIVNVSIPIGNESAILDVEVSSPSVPMDGRTRAECVSLAFVTLVPRFILNGTWKHRVLIVVKRRRGINNPL